jgi:GntR family transcriptional regulator, transcriptional repressor for pyruvate dehydrogenase complex
VATAGSRNPLTIDRIRPAYEQVAVQLRELIAAGQTKPGERLPTEADLAKSFGVSRTTVREALRVLTSEGLIETSRGITGGSFVKRLDAAHVSEFLRSGLSVLVGTDGIQIADVLEARLALEVPAARWAAERRTEDELAALERAIHTPHVKKGAVGVLIDGTMFHLALLDSSHSKLLAALARPVFEVLMELTQKRNLTSPLTVDTDDAHRRIVDAIRRSDSDGAAAAMEQHLASIADAWHKHLSADVLGGQRPAGGRGKSAPPEA